VSAALEETQILSKLHSPHCIRYHDSFFDDEILNIVMAWAENGALGDYIKSQERLPEELVWKYFLQITAGLHHLHQKKILHRDLKSMNVFLDRNMNAKIGDMGAAKVLGKTGEMASTCVGTPYYVSPELCEGRPYNEKSDVWALGVLIYEMCTGTHPFEANNQAALVMRILKGRYAPLGRPYSKDIQDIIRLCLTKDVERRPDTLQLLSHPRAVEMNAQLGAFTTPTISLPPAAAASRRTRPPVASATLSAAEASRHISAENSHPPRGRIVRSSIDDMSHVVAAGAAFVPGELADKFRAVQRPSHRPGRRHGGGGPDAGLNMSLDEEAMALRLQRVQMKHHLLSPSKHFSSDPAGVLGGRPSKSPGTSAMDDLVQEKFGGDGSSFKHFHPSHLSLHHPPVELDGEPHEQGAPPNDNPRAARAGHHPASPLDELVRRQFGVQKSAGRFLDDADDTEFDFGSSRPGPHEGRRYGGCVAHTPHTHHPTPTPYATN